MRKSYGYEGNPLAPLIEPPNNVPATPDRYLVNFKKSIDEARINYHFDRLNEDINKELKEGVKSYIQRYSLHPGYGGKFSKEILEKIRRSDVVNIPTLKEISQVVNLGFIMKVNKKMINLYVLPFFLFLIID